LICLQSLRLKAFRNFSAEIVTFAEGANTFIGQNGQGKSNLLEAIYLICTGRSFRTSHLKELIQFDASEFQLEATLLRRGIPQKIHLIQGLHKKKLWMNQTSYSHFHPLMGFIPVVIMTPEMKKIIDGGPDERRKFLNFLGSQLSRGYFESITRYHKAMKQRNAALKKKESTGIWEQLMSEEWLFIHVFRLKLIEKLHTRAAKYLSKYPELCAHLELHLKTEVPPELTQRSLMALYQKEKKLAEHLGFTLHGPHRDEIEIYLNHKPAHNTASEGQKKMLITALCFACFEILKEELEIEPLVLIDDYDAHFDGIRKTWIQESLQDLSQSFLTSPLDELSENKNAFTIHQGTLLTSPYTKPLV